MDVNVIDDFLPQKDFEEVRDLMVFNDTFPWYFQKEVNSMGTNCDKDFWNWYGTHTFYVNDFPESKNYPMLYDKFIPCFKEMNIYRTLLRIKGNFYPHTETLREHAPHIDYEYSHVGALYSLNTCDGFTKLYDGTKVDSVANRILIFDASTIHNSTTTTTSAGRFNINFNFL